MGYTIWPDGDTGDVLSLVNKERYRQEQLREEGKFKYTCAARKGLSLSDKLAVLAEEFGEVARHVTEGIIDPKRVNREKLKKELIEVAAVAVAWAESLSSEPPR
jgi:NTP pyrophosphatase (non-canonical NTP hydrolase)